MAPLQTAEAERQIIADDVVSAYRVGKKCVLLERDVAERLLADFRTLQDGDVQRVKDIARLTIARDEALEQVRPLQDELKAK